MGGKPDRPQVEEGAIERLPVVLRLRTNRLSGVGFKPFRQGARLAYLGHFSLRKTLLNIERRTNPSIFLSYTASDGTPDEGFLWDLLCSRWRWNTERKQPMLCTPRKEDLNHISLHNELVPLKNLRKSYLKLGVEDILLGLTGLRRGVIRFRLREVIGDYEQNLPFRAFSNLPGKQVVAEPTSMVRN